MERLVGGITMHKPAVAPAVVLSLGNGFDFWAINAAQKWPVCIQLTSLRSTPILTLPCGLRCRNVGSLHTVFSVCTKMEWTLLCNR